MISILGIEQLDQFIINGKNKILMLYFGSNSCSPCNILKTRITKDIENDMPKLSVCYIDVDLHENGEILDIYDNIKILPTLFFVKLLNDEVVIISQIDGYDWIKLIMTYNEIANKN